MPPAAITLRPHQPEDVPILFSFEIDPAWGAIARAKPRDEATFRTAWARVLGERLHQRAILIDGVLCGSIGCLWSPSGAVGRPLRETHDDANDDAAVSRPKPRATAGTQSEDGRWMVGYGLGPAFWGKGIASAALGLLLSEVPHRPLYATAAASNAASIRVLEKHGFVLLVRRTAPETPRTLAREEVEMILEDGIRDSAIGIREENR